MEFDPSFLKYFLFLILFSISNHADGSEKDALYALKDIFNNSFLNDNWTDIQCLADYSQWHGIRCLNGHVSGILLESRKLTGNIRTDAFSAFTELTVLSFKNNSLSGYMMDFSANEKLQLLDLSMNKFDGPISRSLLSLNFLESLQLQENNLTGPIPEFNQSSLRLFNVSNNHLKGSIPATRTLQSFSYDSYLENPELCGPPSATACSPSADNDTASSPSGSHKGTSITDSRTLFLLVDLIGLVAVVLLFILYFKKAKKLKRMMKKDRDQECEENEWDEKDEAGEEEEEKHPQRKEEDAGNTRVVARGEERKNLIFMEGEAGFELNDLLKASAEGLGMGIFGNTYKAMIVGKPAVVVKRLRDLKPLSNEEFTKQLQVIADLKHPNLLPLLAYFFSKDEKLLLYKFAEKGNLFDRIHGGRGSNRERIPFRWSSRLSVVRGIAQALEYLHLNPALQSIVPHGNLKSSNVLLDENDMVLVSDYGLASLITLPVAAQRMVSYRSPEYHTAKKLSRKSDVWSYGCLLLEILTGRIAAHSAPPGINGVDLCNWINRAVREEWTAEIFDIEISVQRSAAPGMVKLLQLAMQCCNRSPEKRPEMTEVVREVENIEAANESEDEEELSTPLDQSLTDESLSNSASIGRSGRDER